MTLELLQQDHLSVLRNPVLAELLYLTRNIEHRGTGIRNMKAWMEEYGLSQPEYKESHTHFMTILKRSPISAEINGGQIGGMKGGMKSGMKKEQEISDRQRQILEIISKNPKISIVSLAKDLNINPSAVQKHIDKLRNNGVLKRTGPAKGGVWEILIDI